MTTELKGNKRSILIVEDDMTQLSHYLGLARSVGLDAHGASSKEDAIKSLAGKSYQFVLTDIHLKGPHRQDTFDGVEILRYLKEHRPEVIPLTMTADPAIESYKRVVAEGGMHHFRKPIAYKEELLIHLDAAQSRWLSRSQVRIGPEGLSPRLQELCPDGLVLPEAARTLALKAAKSGKHPAIISGENGTGKEEVAKLIHKWRCEIHGEVPFVPVNCASLRGEMALSSMFGHRQGAFTGAKETTKGFIGAADGGILFLDEIHALPIECQQQLLRVLNDGSYSRVGDTLTLYSRFQVVVATTKDLDDEVEQGRFLMDLRGRLFGLPILLPPLRQRKDDLPLLVELFFARQEGVRLPEGELARIVTRCADFYWQGNIRQLYQSLQMLIIQADGEPDNLRADNLLVLKTMLAPGEKAPAVEVKGKERGLSAEVLQVLERALQVDQPLTESVEAFERLVLLAAINRHKELKDVAEGLKIGRTTLKEKRHKYEL